MRAAPLAAAALLFVASPAFAHRVDEYLQATTITVDRHRVRLELRLTPGIAVVPTLLATIDTNGDGAISPAEQQRYAERVMRDASLTLDGASVVPRMTVARFATLGEMREGMGTIVLELEADVADARGRHALMFANRHLSQIGAYLVNALAPTDPAIRIESQSRSYDQSSYRLEYRDALGVVPSSDGQSIAVLAWLVAGAIVLAITIGTHVIRRGVPRADPFAPRATPAARSPAAP